TKRSRLRMNTVCSPDNDRGFEFMRALLQDNHEPLQAFKDDRRRFGNLKGHGSIENIGRSQAEVKISGSGTDVLGDGRSEGDNIMLHFSFNCVDPIDRESSFRFDLCRSLFRNDAFLRKYFCGSEFNIKPSLVLVLVLPDGSHSWACVTWYHFLTITESVR